MRLEGDRGPIGLHDFKAKETRGKRKEERQRELVVRYTERRP